LTSGGGGDIAGGMKVTLPLVALALAAAGAVAQPPAAAKLNSVAAKSFTAQVQPVLSNVCADCHAHKTHASPFKLKAYDPAFNDPPTADANLQAVTPLLDVTNPHASPLLKYAATAHGKAADPPLKAGHPALQKLELWVHWACGPEGSAAPTVVPPPPKVDAAVVQTGATQPAPPATEPAKLPPVQPTPIRSFADRPLPEPAKLNPADPFDPAQFNQQVPKK
jgi:hypothetical protein